MKNLLWLIIISIFCSGFSDWTDVNVSYQPNLEKLDSMFKNHIPIKDGIIYTKVPRGLIVSIDENYFFSCGQTKIKESSLTILNTIINLLHELSNYCVVEDHTEDNLNNKYEISNWELSIIRSANLVEYMIECGKLPSSQLFSLGFGEFMPFRDNVSPQKGINNRVDFVILEYEAKR